MKFQSNHPAFSITIVISFIATLLSFFSLLQWYFALPTDNPQHGTWLISSIILWGVLMLIAYGMTFKKFIFAYLAAFFTTLMISRINGLQNNDASVITDIIAVFSFIFSFFYLVKNDLIEGVSSSLLPKIMHQNKAEWAITYFRLYLGYTFIAHFTEKWFAGPVPHDGLVAYFGQDLGLGDSANFMVWLAGACEFGVAVGLVFGFLTRIAAIGGALYLFFATFLGQHFSVGFIWALPKGGWEYGILWMALVIAFAFYGAGRFSIEEKLRHSTTLKLLSRL